MKIIKKIILVRILILTAVILSACSAVKEPAPLPSVEPTQPPAAEPTQPAPAPDTSSYGMPPAAAPLIAAAADALGISPDLITFVSMEPAEWSDGCLGLGGPAEACMAVITPGFKVTLQGPNGLIVFHTNQTMDYYRMEPVVLGGPASGGMLSALVLTWKRTGGIAGVCMELTVTANGQYTLVNCGGEIIASGSLPETDLAYLLQQRRLYGETTWTFEPPQGSADMFIDSYTLAGLGIAAATPEEQAALDEWIGMLVTRLQKAAQADAKLTTGIVLTTLIGPTCGGPVSSGDTQCQDKPYPAEVEVLSAALGLIKTVQTGDTGVVRFSLEPGIYILNPKTSGRFPTAAQQNVIVQPDTYVEVTILFDSGIR